MVKKASKSCKTNSKRIFMHLNLSVNRTRAYPSLPVGRRGVREYKINSTSFTSSRDGMIGEKLTDYMFWLRFYGSENYSSYVWGFFTSAPKW